MTDSLHLEITIPSTTARRVYEAWLDSRSHTKFTGDTADIQPSVGGKFLAFSGYITGKTLELKPFESIIQAWRTTEFPEDAPDSRLEVSFADTPDGCLLVLNQSGLPEDQVESYKEGWEDYYFQPLVNYFSK
jgi:uncharacterized protein YndB with AHSA1/START domain